MCHAGDVSMRGGNEGEYTKGERMRSEQEGF